MRNIEKALTSFVKGNGPRISNYTLTAYAEKDANSLINILFNVINEELDNIKGTVPFDKIRELLKGIYVILGISNDVDRKIVSRKLNKLSEKIERVQLEQRRRINHPDKAKKSFKKIQEEIEHLQEQTEEKENKQYDFMSYLVEEIQNISYLEYTMSKLPNLINTKDKEGHSFFRRIVEQYIKAQEENDREKILYYSNVISLVLSDKKLALPDIEKRRVLDIIYQATNRASVSRRENRKEMLQELRELADHIKYAGEKTSRVEQLSKKYNIAIAFPQPILDQIQFLKPDFSSMSDRKVVQEFIITIDRAGASEIDDALSCKKLPNGNYLLGIHIASVLGYFPYESDIVEEALSRTASIYLPKKYKNQDRVIPMFPYEFGANKGSLLENQQRLTRSYYFEISKDGEIVQEVFPKTIITSNRRTTYREIDRVLEHGSKDLQLQETVQNLKEVTDILDKVYKPSRLYEKIKEYTDDASDLRVKRIGAEKIVAQTMMLTGNRVANFFADPKRDYPCLYRVLKVDEEDSRKLESMIDNLIKTYGGGQYQKLYQLVDGLYPKGWYAMEGSHDGLGLDHYCHCTSELRRGADIVIEHGLEVCYDKEPTDKELDKLAAEIKLRAAEINAKADPIDWFIQDYKRAYQKRR